MPQSFLSSVNCSITLNSPAKFNPYLQVGRQMKNGYHKLDLGLQFLDLADWMKFSLIKNKVIFDYSLPFKRKDDLCFKAIKLLKQTANYQNKKNKDTLGIKIELKKNIPFGSGLAGGSSNAASTLIALNYLWDLNLSKKELSGLGLKIGSDIPFFIYGKAAKGSGVGEKLMSFNFKECDYLLLYPKVPVSTKAVFNHPNLIKRNSFKKLEIEDYFNDCTDLTLSLYPEVKKAYDFLSQFGKVSMSGTGSSLLLESTSAEFENVIKSQKELVSKKWSLYSVRSLNKSPLNIQLRA